MLKHLKNFKIEDEPFDTEKHIQHIRALRRAAVEMRDARGEFKWSGKGYGNCKSTVPDQFVPYATDWLP